MGGIGARFSAYFPEEQALWIAVPGYYDGYLVGDFQEHSIDTVFGMEMIRKKPSDSVLANSRLTIQKAYGLYDFYRTGVGSYHPGLFFHFFSFVKFPSSGNHSIHPVTQEYVALKKFPKKYKPRKNFLVYGRYRIGGNQIYYYNKQRFLRFADVYRKGEAFSNLYLGQPPYTVDWPNRQVLYANGVSGRTAIVDLDTEEVRYLQPTGRFSPSDSIFMLQPGDGYGPREHYKLRMNQIYFLSADSVSGYVFRAWREGIEDTVDMDWRITGAGCNIKLNQGDVTRMKAHFRRPGWLQVFDADQQKLVAEYRLPEHTSVVWARGNELILFDPNPYTRTTTFYRARLELPQATVQE